MSKRNTRAGTSRAETSTALPTVPVPKKKENQFLKNSLRSLRFPGFLDPPSLPGFPDFPGFPKNYREIN